MISSGMYAEIVARSLSATPDVLVALIKATSSYEILDMIEANPASRNVMVLKELAWKYSVLEGQGFKRKRA